MDEACGGDTEANRLLIAVARAHRASAAALLGEIGLHPGQEILVLTLGAQGATTVSNLAATLEVEVPTITKMVGRMEAAGLVQRSPDPADGRAVRVSLTEKGTNLRVSVRERWEQLEQRLLAGMDAEEEATFRTLLARAAESLRAGLDGAPDCGGSRPTG